MENDDSATNPRSGSKDDDSEVFEAFSDETHSLDGEDQSDFQPTQKKTPASPDKENKGNIPSSSKTPDIFQAALKLTSKPKLRVEKAAASPQVQISSPNGPGLAGQRLEQSWGSLSKKSSFPVLPKGTTFSAKEFEREIGGGKITVKKPKPPPLEFSDDDDDDEDLFEIKSEPKAPQTNGSVDSLNCSGNSQPQDNVPNTERLDSLNHSVDSESKASPINEWLDSPTCSTKPISPKSKLSKTIVEDALQKTSSKRLVSDSPKSPFVFDPGEKDDRKTGIPTPNFREFSVCKERGSKRKWQGNDGGGGDPDLENNEGGEVGWSDAQNEVREWLKNCMIWSQS